MPKPISRRELVRRMRLLGWEGPFPGKRHGNMRKGTNTIPIPNPHRGELDWSLVKRVLRQAEIGGREYTVPTPDHAAVNPKGTYVVLFSDDDSHADVAGLHVAAVVKQTNVQD